MHHHQQLFGCNLRFTEINCTVHLILLLHGAFSSSYDRVVSIKLNNSRCPILLSLIFERNWRQTRTTSTAAGLTLTQWDGLKKKKKKKRKKPAEWAELVLCGHKALLIAELDSCIYLLNFRTWDLWSKNSQIRF